MATKSYIFKIEDGPYIDHCTISSDLEKNFIPNYSDNNSKDYPMNLIVMFVSVFNKRKFYYYLYPV